MNHNAHAKHWLGICHRPATHLLPKSRHNCSTHSRELFHHHLIRRRCCRRSFIESRPFVRFRIFGRCMSRIMHFCGSWGSWRFWRSSLLSMSGRNCVCRAVLSAVRCRINISNRWFTTLSIFSTFLPYIKIIGYYSDQKCSKMNCSPACFSDLTQRRSFCCLVF